MVGHMCAVLLAIVEGRAEDATLSDDVMRGLIRSALTYLDIKKVRTVFGAASPCCKWTLDSSYLYIWWIRAVVTATLFSG